MTEPLIILAATAASIGLVHTLIGPDHYVPFIALAGARKWSLSKTLGITAVCGVGHVLGSVVLGGLGILLGLALGGLEWFEGFRGEIAGWLLLGFGLAYMAWGLRQAYRNRPHSHWHSHGDVTHDHLHTHHEAHAHLHEKPAAARSLAPWLIFVIFVLGPCEPLIPLLMYPAARESLAGVIMVSVVFGAVTVATMLLAVFLSVLGLRNIKLKPFERYGHALAGGAILVCGLSVAFLGL